MPYDPGPDVVEVVRAPKGGPVRGTYRAFGETLRGLRTTLGRVAEGHHVIQYPEERLELPPWTRGRPRLIYDVDSGDLRCTACGERHHYPRALCPFCGSDATDSRTGWANERDMPSRSHTTMFSGVRSS